MALKDWTGLCLKANIGIVFLCHYCAFVLASTSTVIVDAPFGKLKGRAVDGDPSYVVFRNIPYAKPPVGELRFAKPQPHPKLEGVFDATDDREIRCVHPQNMQFSQSPESEDCLILNVIAKKIEPGKSKKVIVNIHGGGYVAGSSALFAVNSFVSNHDIIGVSFNYRLGIMGFLSTGNEVSPGNYGLWDQALALQWVKDNIQAFGGDPNDVTIMGESAGGASVGLQTVSPITKGLFTKAWATSGLASSAFHDAANVQKQALKVGKHANCWDGDINQKLNVEQSERLIQCLRKVSDATFFSSVKLATQGEPEFVPRVDGEFVPKKPLLLLQDQEYLDSIGFYDRTYIILINNNENAITKTYHDMSKYMVDVDKDISENEKNRLINALNNDKKDHFIKSRLDPEDDFDFIKDKVLDFYSRRYTGDDVVVQMVTDVSFLIPVYDFLNAASTKGKGCKAWFLYFDYYPSFTKGTLKGSLHGTEVLFWRDSSVAEMEQMLHSGLAGEMDEDDLRLKSLFSSLIAEFVKTGDPGSALKELLPSGWPTYDPDKGNYLSFNLDPTIRSFVQQDIHHFWFKKIPQWQKLMKKTHSQHTEL